MTRRALRANACVALALAVLLVGFATTSDGGRLAARQGAASTSVAIDTVSFAEDVLPVFREYCAECHGGTNEAGEVVTEVSLNLVEYDQVMAGSEFGTVVEAGDPDGSFLVDQIESGDMPMDRPKLAAENIALVRAWILAGAMNN